MNEQEVRTIKEAVEIGKKLRQVMDGVFWKGKKSHPEKIELLKGLDILIDFASLKSLEPKVGMRRNKIC